MSSVEKNSMAIRSVLNELPHDEIGLLGDVIQDARVSAQALLGESDNPDAAAVIAYLGEASDRVGYAGVALEVADRNLREYIGEDSSVERAAGAVAVAEETPPRIVVPEYGPPAEEDMALARRILGEDFDYDREAEYDEFRVIIEDIAQAREKLRERMKRALLAGAEITGIQIDDDAIADWVPTDKECESIADIAKDAVRRYRTIVGVGQFLEDMEDEAAELGVPLKPYQKAEAVDFYDFLRYSPPTSEEGGKAGVTEMPTGTGKTAIMAKRAAMLLHATDPNDLEDGVLILEPRQKLLDQMLGRKGERGLGMFAPHLKDDIGEIWQDIHPLDRDEQLAKKVVVMTYAQFNMLVASGKMRHFPKVMADEVHMASQGVTGQNLREYIKGKTAVGLSATAEYDDERSAYKIFPHSIHKMTLVEAVRFGYLAPVRGYLHDIKPVIDYSALPTDKAARRNAIMNAYRDAWALKTEEIVAEAAARGVGVAIKCSPGEDIEAAVSFAARLSDKLVKDPSLPFGQRWLKAKFVGGSARRQTRGNRDKILDEYELGDIDALTYNKALNVGWDSSHCKVHIDNSGGTTSKVEEAQTDGRALRLTRDEKGDPIWAELHTFKNPFLGDKQYTCLDLLQLENSGDGIAHEAQPAIPRPRKRYRRVRPVVEEVIERNLEVSEISHMVELGPMTQEELARITAARKGGKVPLDEACRILGISPPTLKGILTNLGTAPTGEIEIDELTTILELYPGLQAEPLPAGNDFVPALEVRNEMPGFVRSFTLLAFARTHGIMPYRFTQDEKVRFFFSREQADRLKQIWTEEHN